MHPPLTQQSVRSYFAANESGTINMIKAHLQSCGVETAAIYTAIAVLIRHGELSRKLLSPSSKRFIYTKTELLGRPRVTKQDGTLFKINRDAEATPEGILMLDSVMRNMAQSRQAQSA